MTPTNALFFGFVLGSIVVGIAMAAIMARYKWENLKAKSILKVQTSRLHQVEKHSAILTKNLIDANAEREYTKQEVDRLRNQKLDAWGIPGGLDNENG